MRVLFLTQRLPYAPNRGDRLRAYHMLRVLRGRAKVDLVSLVHDDDEASRAGTMGDLADSVTALRITPLHRMARGCQAWWSGQPLTHGLLDARGAADALAALVARRRPDVVFAYCTSMARFGCEPPLDRFPLVVDFVDVDSAKWQALASAGRWPLSAVYAREARTLSAFESRVARTAAATLLVNEREREALRAIDPEAQPIVLENGVDVAYFMPPGPPSASPAVVFSGVMNYAPNADGAVWLAGQVWPLVRRVRPDARLTLAGAAPGRAIRQLAQRDASIAVTGSIPSVREYLWDAAVAVAPLRIARGVQNKVVEAVAAGLPCVITPEVDRGVPHEVRAACTVRESPEDFARAILQLLDRSPAERRAIAARADVGAIDWETRMARLPSILEDASTRGRQDAGRIRLD